MTTKRGKRFTPCDATPSRLESAKRRAHWSARSRSILVAQQHVAQRGVQLVVAHQHCRADSPRGDEAFGESCAADATSRGVAREARRCPPQSLPACHAERGERGGPRKVSPPDPKDFGLWMRGRCARHRIATRRAVSAPPRSARHRVRIALRRDLRVLRIRALRVKPARAHRSRCRRAERYGTLRRSYGDTRHPLAPSQCAPPSPLAIATLVLVAARRAASPRPQRASDSLEIGFRDPPPSARPRTWWHWTQSNVTKEGITKDLEWMKRVGIARLPARRRERRRRADGRAEDRLRHAGVARRRAARGRRGRPARPRDGPLQLAGLEPHRRPVGEARAGDEEARVERDRRRRGRGACRWCCRSRRRTTARSGTSARGGNAVGGSDVLRRQRGDRVSHAGRRARRRGAATDRHHARRRGGRRRAARRRSEHRARRPASGRRQARRGSSSRSPSRSPARAISLARAAAASRSAACSRATTASRFRTLVTLPGAQLYRPSSVRTFAVPGDARARLSGSSSPARRRAPPR